MDDRDRGTLTGILEQIQNSFHRMFFYNQIDDQNQSKEEPLQLNIELFKCSILYVIRILCNSEYGEKKWNTQPVPQAPPENVKGNSPTLFSEQFSILFILKSF